MILKTLSSRTLTEVLAAVSPAARLGFILVCAGLVLMMSFSFASSTDVLPLGHDPYLANSYRPLAQGELRNQGANSWRFNKPDHGRYGSVHRFGHSLWPEHRDNRPGPVAGPRPWGNVEPLPGNKPGRYAAMDRVPGAEVVASYSYGDLNPFEPLPIRPISYTKAIPAQPRRSYPQGPARLQSRVLPGGAGAILRPYVPISSSLRQGNFSTWRANRPW